MTGLLELLAVLGLVLAIVIVAGLVLVAGFFVWLFAAFLADFVRGNS